METTDYTIVTAPTYVVYTCPHCKTEHHDFITEFDDGIWNSGSHVECAECGAEINLHGLTVD